MPHVHRLVATDLDGTIVRSDGTISARTVRVLAALEERGVDVVFVTGRPPRWMHPIADATGHRGEAICANGAYVYDLHAEQVTEAFLLEPALAREVVRRVRTVLPRPTFAVEAPGGFAHEPGYPARWEVDKPRLAPIEELLDRPVAKLLVRDESGLGDDLLALARPVLDGVAEVVHSNSRDSLLEVAAPGVSKASTLARLCTERGIAREQVVAFGDMPNDLPLLAWAGTPYAMGNGHAEVLGAVSRRAPACDEDGVACVLEDLFGL